MTGSTLRDAETIERHGARNLPRYTSYPTAPCFTGAVTADDYRGWLSELPATAELSLYLHIPFCRSMCWYCACHTTVTARQAPVSRYLAALRREIALVAEALGPRRAVRHVHFGGGSPTMMRPDEIGALAADLRSAFALSDDAEIAIEIDPRTLSAEMAGAIAAAGVNRASLGIQTFDERVQEAINRVQSFECVATAVGRLRDAGIAALNFDLIYGLPLQTLPSCLATVDAALRLEPDRLAVFGYAHVPGFKLHQRRIDERLLPASRARWEQTRAIGQALVAAGYVEVGLDHYAKPGDSLALAASGGELHRNFQGYTTDACPALIGLGASAIGRLPQGYVQNCVNIADYQERLRTSALPVLRGYAVDADDRLRADVIERLMCDQRVDLAAVCEEHGADPNALLRSVDLQPLLADELITLNGMVIAVAPRARPLVRSVAAAFDAHLQATSGRHSTGV